MATDLELTDLAPEAPQVQDSEAAFKQSEVFDLAKHDLDFLAALAMPDSITFGFPPVFKAVWELLLSIVYKKRDFTKLALGLPRGFGKTTLIKLLVVYCILYTEKKFILVTAATATLADNIISDVFDMLDEDNIKKVYGDWRLGVEQDTMSKKKFGFRGRNIIVAAIGQGGNVRGLNIKNARPDVMIFEDIQSREDADSESVSMGIDRWMVGTAIKAKAPDGCLYVFIANMYPTKWSLLRRLKHNPGWVKFIAGGILSDGTSLWEELQPLKQLLEEWKSDRDSGHEAIFHSEVLNDERASVNNKIDITKLPPYPYDVDGELSAGGFLVVDPSNDKANSDMVAIGAFEVYGGTPVICEVINEKLSPSKIVEKTLELAMSRGSSLIAVEAVAFQYSLCHWFEKYMETLGISSITVVPIYPGRRTKNSRILEMFKSLIEGEIYLHPKVLSQVLDQAQSFNPLRTDNVDDILDTLTYSPRVIEEFGDYITVLVDQSIEAHGDLNSLSVHETSSF